MQEFINGDVIANAIRMKRTHFDGSFLIVEGRSDKLVYERLVDIELCHIEIALGRDPAIHAIRILNADHIDGVLAIVDSDFTGITSKTFSEERWIQV